MKTYIKTEFADLNRDDYLFLWFLHTKAMEMTLDEFLPIYARNCFGSRARIL